MMDIKEDIRVNDDVNMCIYIVYFILRKKDLRKWYIGRNYLNLAGLAQIDQKQSE